MKKKILYSGLFLALSVTFSYSESITVEKNKWQLLGVPFDSNISDLDLRYKDMIWLYDGSKNSWLCYKESIEGGLDKSIKDICITTTKIKAGSGFWLKSKYDYNLDLKEKEKKQPSIVPGWNLISVDKEVSVDNFLTSNNLSIIWKYNKGKWSGYSKIYNYNIDKLNDTLKEYEGFWAYNSYLLYDGFSFIKKSSEIKTTELEKVWNMSFRIDKKDIDKFMIAIKIDKEATGAKGEVILSGMSIKDGKLSAPTFIGVYGKKSNGNGGSESFSDSGSNKDFLTNSVSLENDILTLRVGLIMKKQSIVGLKSFTAISNYKVIIASDKVDIQNAKKGDVSLPFSNGSINNGSIISGYINIVR